MRVFLERDLVLVSSLGQLRPPSLKPGTILRSLKCNPCSWKTRRAGAWRMPEKAWVICGSRVEVAMLGSTCHPRLFLETRGSEGFPCTRDGPCKREREGEILDPFWVLLQGASVWAWEIPHEKNQWQQKLRGDWGQHMSTSWGSQLGVTSEDPTEWPMEKA